VDPVRKKRARAASAAILAAWTVAATLFAWRRIPFYDEWFSITLARDTTWPVFKASLAADVHPPWLALLDRALVAVCPDRRILCVPRLAASLLAILVLRRVVLRQWPSVSTNVVALAAFHPVVFMFAGAVRWYPFAFLADALRAWALWGTSDRRAAKLAFFAGAVLGVISGYAEALLSAVDAAWMLGRAPDRRTTATVLAAGAAAMGTVLAAPFVRAWPYQSPGASLGPVLRSLVTWAALGPLGSVVVPWPYTPVVLLALPGLVWGLARGLASGPARPLSRWIVSVAAGWVILTAHGIVHPRYSLALWYLTTCALGLLGATGVAHAAKLATASYLGIALWLTVRQHDFAFEDENEISPSECAQLIPTSSTQVVTSYLRTADELRLICGAPQVVSARNARIYAPYADLGPIRDALHGGPVTFVHPNSPGSLIDGANDRIRSLLVERCKLGDTRPVAPSPLAPLRRVFRPDAKVFRYTSESWVCD
jgi:hypothetical protein